MTNNQLNTQKIMKPAYTDGSELLVHSCFWTLQGEGPFTGRPAVFLRLAGCNLMCPMCDTEYTQGATRRPLGAIADTIQRTRPVAVTGQPLLVITGGEPFRQNIAPLVDAMLVRGWTVQVETNGVLQPQDWPSLQYWTTMRDFHVIVSPKTSRVCPIVNRMAKAYKYVLAHDSVDPDDGLPTLALNNKARPRIARPAQDFMGDIYVNPMDSKSTRTNQKNLIACADSCMRFGYTMGLQIHKYIGLE